MGSEILCEIQRETLCDPQFKRRPVDCGLELKGGSSNAVMTVSDVT